MLRTCQLNLGAAEAHSCVKRGLRACPGRKCREEGGCEGVSGPRHVDGRERHARCRNDVLVTAQKGASCAELDNDGCPGRLVEYSGCLPGIYLLCEPAGFFFIGQEVIA